MDCILSENCVGNLGGPGPSLLPAAFNAGVRKFVEQEPPFSIDRFEA